ncbi:AraC family transcriptional regulator [Micromonospora sp. NPDC094482]|uniref:AraC family transcriptional regulator n=1 Tax=unclassified Micromonospora TaxID=2617518 RepID=UPI00332FB3E4
MASPPAGAHVSAWRPAVAGVAEVFHARFVDHAYPSHTHDAWTLLIVDDGAVRYDLDRHRHGALPTSVTLLPPYVPHDGRSATREGFRKRVLYLDTSVLDAELAGRAVGRPSLADPRLRYRIHQLHQVLARPGDELEADSRLAFVLERLGRHLRRQTPATVRPSDRGLAVRMRELLDARTAEGLTLREAGELLHAHPTHLVRTFTRVHGLPPHAYLTSRRIDLARRLLLAGQRPADVAAAAGFFDQAHLTRHFTRHLGVGPARYARPDPAR